MSRNVESGLFSGSGGGSGVRSGGGGSGVNSGIPIEDQILAWGPEYYWPLVDASYANLGDGGTEPVTVVGGFSDISSSFGQVGDLVSPDDCYATDATVVPSTSVGWMNNGFTTGAFVRLDSGSGVCTIVGNGNIPANFSSRNFDFYVDRATGELSFRLFAAGVSTIYALPTILTDNNWHHVAAQYDMATARVWIDGIAVWSTARTASQNANTGQRVVIGAADNSAGAGGPSSGTFLRVNGWDGSIAHAFLMDDSIGTTQIQPVALAGGVASPPSLSDAILALSPLGYWKLDEDSGTTATDSSGNARHGTYNGTLTLNSIAGPDGQSYPDFSDGYVSIPDDTAFTLATTPGLSFFAIIIPDTQGAAGLKFLISKGNTAAYEWQLNINNTVVGYFDFEAFRSTTGTARRNDRTSSATLSSAAWQPIGVTRAGQAHTDPTTFYRNGQSLAVTNVNSSSAGTNDNTASSVMIGARADITTGALLYDGGIAHVAIFSGVVTPAQYAALMMSAAADGWY